MQTVQTSDTQLCSAAPTQSRRAKSLAAAIASLALLAAGCGTSSPANPTAGSPVSFTAAVFKYSSCMRDHGLSSFPDPTMTDHDGQQVAYLTATIPVDPSPAFKNAENACRSILPSPINASPTQLAQQRQAREQRVVGEVARTVLAMLILYIGLQSIGLVLHIIGAARGGPGGGTDASETVGSVVSAVAWLVLVFGLMRVVVKVRISRARR